MVDALENVQKKIYLCIIKIKIAWDIQVSTKDEHILCIVFAMGVYILLHKFSYFELFISKSFLSVWKLILNTHWRECNAHTCRQTILHNTGTSVAQTMDTSYSNCDNIKALSFEHCPSLDCAKGENIISMNMDFVMSLNLDIKEETICKFIEWKIWCQLHRPLSYLLFIFGSISRKRWRLYHSLHQMQILK